MTTEAQFAEKIGIRSCDVGWARKQLKGKGEWPGEDLTERMTITPKIRAAYTWEVRSLSPEQQEAIIQDLVRRVENKETRVEGVIDFVRAYKERMIEGGVPKDAWSPRDRERMGRRERPKGYPEHPNV